MWELAYDVNDAEAEPGGGLSERLGVGQSYKAAESTSKQALQGKKRAKCQLVIKGETGL